MSTLSDKIHARLVKEFESKLDDLRHEIVSYFITDSSPADAPEQVNCCGEIQEMKDLMYLRGYL